VRAYHRTYGLQTTITFCSNNYGAYQHPEKLIPSIIRDCLSGNRLSIYGDGLNVRDWLHVEDHCRGIDLVLRRGQPGESYNIGGGEERPNLALIDMLCAIIDRTFADRPGLARRFPNAPAAQGLRSITLKSFVTDRPGHDRRYAIDDTKARNALGYRPLRTLAEGLQNTVDWYLADRASPIGARSPDRNE
jgi:dTDP-glucose 4,6-dehydratase